MGLAVRAVTDTASTTLTVIPGVVVFGARSVNATIAEEKPRFTIYEYNYIDFTLTEYPEV